MMSIAMHNIKKYRNSIDIHMDAKTIQSGKTRSR